MLDSKNQICHGSCLCGEVKFQILYPSVAMNHCYCSRCRKASGAEYGTFLHTTLDFFKWLSGEENINHFIPQQGDPRPFCKTCGSRVPKINQSTKHVVIPAGLLDDTPDNLPSVNLYVASKAKWHTITNTLPCYDENAPPEFWTNYLLAFQEKIKK